MRPALSAGASTLPPAPGRSVSGARPGARSPPAAGRTRRAAHVQEVFDISVLRLP
ncbi:hypothetical protein ACKI1K_31920 [Streptomyces scabiei]|uniref:hypothetical protein n=1 Tax=Streptomyces scabiei TaxID=1930 RepID=UPI000305E18C